MEAASPLPQSLKPQEPSTALQQDYEVAPLLPVQPQFVRHDSEISVSSDYQYPSPNNLNVWQGAALLAADCLGTGILALPGDMQVLGWRVGITFLALQLPINLYAGTILSQSAAYVEEQQLAANQRYSSSSVSSGQAGNVSTYPAVVYNSTDTAIPSSHRDGSNDHSFGLQQPGHEAAQHHHTRLHHDTASFDFIGMTGALFGKKAATRWTMAVYYTNIFLVLGNYILVMSRAVQAVWGSDDNESSSLCLPVAGLIATATVLLVVSQGRTMARLGRTASILSLTALMIVVIQCLAAVHQQQKLQPISNDRQEEVNNDHDELTSLGSVSIWRKLSALGSIGFAVGSQKLFLNIRHELSDRSTAPTSLAWALSAFGTLYVLVVFAAGSNPPSFLFDAIPTGNSTGWNSRRLAGALLWAHVVVSYAINSQAICSSMDRLVWDKLARFCHKRISIDLRLSSSQRWLVLTSLMALTAYTVANAIPFFKDLVGLIGALTSVPLTLMFPAIFWRQRCALLKATKSLASWALLVFAVVFTVAATIGSFASIEKDWSASLASPFSCRVK